MGNEGDVSGDPRVLKDTLLTPEADQALVNFRTQHDGLSETDAVNGLLMLGSYIADLGQFSDILYRERDTGEIRKITVQTGNGRTILE